jgi:predicted nuclease with TOPRIM domain
MFENNIFEKWLDEKSQELVNKIGSGEALSSEEMIILVLKAQSNHFYHLDKDLRDEMRELREDTTKQIIELRKDMDRKFEQVEERFKQVDKRFEQVDKRFEQVDKRFEQVDKRFDAIIARMDRFMIWSLGLTVSSTLFILGMMYKLIG